MYSNPPLHGALLVSTILSDPSLSSLWYSELRGMADRIKTMRAELRSRLEGGGDEKWAHITDQIGMFCYTGMTKEQVSRLICFVFSPLIFSTQSIHMCMSTLSSSVSGTSPHVRVSRLPYERRAHFHCRHHAGQCRLPRERDPPSDDVVITQAGGRAWLAAANFFPTYPHPTPKKRASKRDQGI